MLYTTSEITINSQQIFTYQGLHYKQVWKLSDIEHRYSYDDVFYDYYTIASVPHSGSLIMTWLPPFSGMTGQVQTYGIQPAIDAGFLELVAPVKDRW